MIRNLQDTLWKSGFRALLIGFLIVIFALCSFFFNEINKIYHQMTSYAINTQNVSKAFVNSEEEKLKEISNYYKTSLTQVIEKARLKNIAENIPEDFVSMELSQEIVQILSALKKQYIGLVSDENGNVLGSVHTNINTVESTLTTPLNRSQSDEPVFSISEHGLGISIPLPTATPIYLTILKQTRLDILMQLNQFKDIYENFSKVKKFLYAVLICALLLIVSLFLTYSFIIIRKLSNKILNNLNLLLQIANQVKYKDHTQISDIKIEEFAIIAQSIITHLHNLHLKNLFINGVLDHVSSGVIMLDETYNIILINKKALTLLKLENIPPINESIKTYFKELDEMLQESQLPFTTNIDTKLTRFLVNASQLNNNILITFDDISYQISMQKQIAWRDVARVVAHEIKNPLTPTKLCAEQILNNPDMPQEKQYKYLSIIINNVDHVTKLINDFTQFTKQIQQELKLTNFNLLELIKEIIILQELAYPEAIFNINIPSNSIIQADKMQINQALTNLIQNAAQACIDTKPIITISYTHDNHLHTISVEDNGIGILDHNLEKIFQPYMTTKKYGTGLGLFVVKRIAQTHNGDITLKSNTPNPGITACFTLRK